VPDYGGMSFPKEVNKVGAMRVLVTGVTGFAGSHLAELCLARGAEVWGVKRWRSDTSNIDHVLDKIHLVDADLTDPAAVRYALESSKPDLVFHLAAQSYVPASFIQPRETFHTNISSTLNLLHGLREKLCGRLLVTGTSEEYGLVHPEETPIKETNQLRPLSPYGVSKVACDLMAYQYHKSYGLDVVRTRAFNHEGPRRGHVFVTSAFVRQAVMIERGLQKHVIKVGNLDPVRDFTDVRDTVAGYWDVAERGRAGEVYNICSGVGVKMQDLVDMVVSRCQAKGVRIEIDPKLTRPSDVPLLIGSNAKITEEVGWMRTIPFEKTIDGMFTYWRGKIVNERGLAA